MAAASTCGIPGEAGEAGIHAGAPLCAPGSGGARRGRAGWGQRRPPPRLGQTPAGPRSPAFQVWEGAGRQGRLGARAGRQPACALLEQWRRWHGLLGHLQPLRSPPALQSSVAASRPPPLPASAHLEQAAAGAAGLGAGQGGALHSGGHAADDLCGGQAQLRLASEGGALHGGGRAPGGGDGGADARDRLARQRGALHGGGGAPDGGGGGAGLTLAGQGSLALAGEGSLALAGQGGALHGGGGAGAGAHRLAQRSLEGARLPRLGGGVGGAARLQESAGGDGGQLTQPQAQSTVHELTKEHSLQSGRRSFRLTCLSPLPSVASSRAGANTAGSLLTSPTCTSSLPAIRGLMRRSTLPPPPPVVDPRAAAQRASNRGAEPRSAAHAPPACPRTSCRASQEGQQEGAAAAPGARHRERWRGRNLGLRGGLRAQSLLVNRVVELAACQ